MNTQDDTYTRITQNGKIRNYVSYIENELPIIGHIELRAEGKAISKLVTTVEVVKQLFYSKTIPIYQINEICASTGRDGEKSLMKVVLSTKQLEVTHTGYQVNTDIRDQTEVVDVEIKRKTKRNLPSIL
jgi:DNA-binding protein